MHIISLIVFSKLLLHFPQLRGFVFLTEFRKSNVPNVILSHIGTSFNAHMRHVFTTLKEQFLS